TSSAESVPAINGIRRERLFKGSDAQSGSILIDRIAFAPGTTLQLELSNNSAAWLHILDGSVVFKAFDVDRLDNRHSAFLPPGFKASLTCEKTASLLYVEVPDVAPIDDKLHRPLFIVTEWAREEALVCEQNARKRVPLVSPAMCDIRALKV